MYHFFSMPFRYLLPCIIAVFSLPTQNSFAQCPTLNQDATLNSPDCVASTTPCDVCPGDVITLTGSGTALVPGSCVDWYYGTNTVFNPYNGEGTFLGCSAVEAQAPNPCGTCPNTLGIFVDACGTEENNEFLVLYSGSGFQVNDLGITYDPSNTVGMGNASIGAGCNFQTPIAATIANLQASCPSALVIGVGPGQFVPAGVPVFVFTSAGYDANYDFSSICAQAPVIYVMQSECLRTIGAFTNGGAGGFRTTTVSLACGCTQSTTYNTNLLVGGNGAYVTNAGLPTTYGNNGCALPALAGIPPAANPIQPTPFNANITLAMCNGGPYYVVGVVNPLSGVCAQTFTNYMQFNVICPTATLGSASICENSGLYDLSQIADPAVPNGAWSGPGVTGNMFDPSGLSGNVNLTFTPSAQCGISSNTSVTVTAGPSANLVLTGSSTICQGDMTQFRVNISNGTAPYTITYSINGVAQAPIVTNLNPYNFNLSPNGTSTVALTAISSNGCSGQVTGSALVTVDTLSAVLSGGGQICQNGSGIDLIINFTGTPPYTFTYEADMVSVGPITTSNNPYLLHVSPTSGTIYNITSLSNGQCPGTFSGTAVVFVFTPSTALLSGDQTVCDSAMTFVNVDFTGTGPFNLVYAINGVAQPEIATFDDPYLIPVDTNLTVMYTLISVESPGCVGNVQGSATVTVNYAPTYTNFKTNCFPATNDYTIEFDVLGATLPLSLVTGSGTFTANHFVSNPIPQAMNYNIIFHDANLCGDIVVAGPSICNCVSASGTMAPDTVHACVGSLASAVYLGVPTLDPNDSLRFLLHSSPGLPLGTLLGWSDSPSFGLGAGMQTGIVYYISAVAGNYAGNDSIDLADICRSVSAGAPIIFHNLPTASLGPDTTICSGSPLTLPVDLTGTPPFDLLYSINGVPQIPITGININTYSLVLAPGIATQITLDTIFDKYCSKALNDTLNINVNTTPQITNMMDTCSALTLTYTIEFDVVGGQAPFTVTGVSGNFVGNHFTSDPIPSNTAYSLILSDGNACGQSTASDSIACACLTDAGSMDLSPLNLCNGDTAFAIHNGAPMPMSGDSLVFLLHTMPDTILGTILGENSAPVFAFDPSTMTFGVTYYISAVVGHFNGLVVDLADPCLDVSAGTPVTWYQTPSASLSGNFDICSGQSQSLTITFTGTPPYNFTYLKNGVLTNGQAFQNNFVLNTTLIQTTTYILVSVSDTHCTGTAMGQAVITVHDTPQIVNPVVNCNPNNLTYTVEFDVQGGDNPTVTLPGVLNAQNGHFISDPINLPTAYQAIVSDSWQCGADTLAGTPNCPCVTNAGQITSQALNICVGSDIQTPAVAGSNLDANDALQYVLCNDPALLPMGILAQSNQPQFAFFPALQTGQTYYMVAIAGNVLPNGDVDFNDPCHSISPSIAVHIRAIPTAMIAGDTTICIGSNYAFPVTFTGTGPFNFSYNVNGGANQNIVSPQPSFLISTNNVQQTQIFTPVSVQDQFCTGTVSGSVHVNIRPNPELALIGGDQLCPGASGQLSLQINNADSADLVILANPGGVLNFNGIGNGESFTVTPSTNTLYTIQSATVYGNNCTPLLSGTANMAFSSIQIGLTPSDYNGLNISCAGAMDGSVQAAVTGGFSPLTLNWSTGDNGTAVITDLSPGAYSFTVTDAAGCTKQASVELTEPAPILLETGSIAPDCRAGSTGRILITNIQSGVAPYSVQIDNGQSMAISALPVSIPGVSSGTHNVTLTDANGCTAQAFEQVAFPPSLNLELGPDQTIYPGDSALLDALIQGGPLSSIVWTPLEGISSPDTTRTFASPAISTKYQLTIADTSGCVAVDEVNIIVVQSTRVFIPNALYPESNLGNNILTVYAGPEVKAVNYFRIYDRWGELIYEALNFTPNSLNIGWEGKWNGKWLDPGVFIYAVEVEYQDGKTEVKSGTITLIR